MKCPTRAIAFALLFLCGGLADFVNSVNFNFARAADIHPADIHASQTAASPHDQGNTAVKPWRYAPLTKPIELTGEVVDSWCYSSQVMGPGRGDRHKACGLACAHGGVTLGIVDDNGILYIAAKHQGYTGCKELLIPFMAKRVKVVGWLAEKGGCKILKIRTVQEVK
jgi:hypothetical protein